MRVTRIGVGGPALVILVVAAIPAAGNGSDREAKLAFFEKKVRPVLTGHCSACHAAETKPAGGLRVDDRNGLLVGGNSGPAVVPGKPSESLLLKRVTHADGKKRMPAEGEPLSAAQVADLTTWITDGAAWPAVAVPASFGKPKALYERLKKEHWAWQPLTDPKTPPVRDAAWPADDVDRFLLARMEERGLKPVADADKVTLLRRVTFDLTGLPPMPAEIDAFLKDESSEAFAHVVDRLLASPRFGERWGRHWLDVARYGESTGPSRNIPYPHAWKYRDYVLDAVAADVPFDRFLTEQIAGDLLPAASATERDRLLTATGFLALGVKDVNQRFKVRFVMDNVDEQIDVVTRAALGLTVSCARCHDHKFDPIPQSDYYALAGIFTSTDNCAGVRNKMGGGGLDYYDPSMLVSLATAPAPVPSEKAEKLKAELAEAKKAWDAIRGTPEGLKPAANGQPTQRPFRLKYEALQAEVNALNDPAARGHAVHGVRDARTVGDTEVRVRGEAERLGPVVPRGFLTAFPVANAVPVNPKQSGRLELAQWLVHPNNPLTPRVAVNRVWAHLFGRGLVATVDNFGTMGDAPSHPDLLDHLTTRFVRDGWSMKKLVRALVQTRAYRLAADFPDELRQADPANKLVARHTPRRLDAEEVRDGVLAAAGTLDLRRPGPPPSQSLRMVEMRDNGPEATTLHDASDKSASRSVYLPLVRGVTPHALEAFDPVDQTLVSGSRDVATVPGQALFLLNSEFVRAQSQALAARLGKETESQRISTAYRRVLGREPSAREVDRAADFLTDYAAASGRSDAAWTAFVQALFASAEFRYVR